MPSQRNETVYPKTLLGSLRPVLIPIFLFSCVINLLAGTGPLFMLQVVDRVLPTGDLSALLALMGVAIFALLILAVLDCLRGLMMFRAASWWERQAHAALLPKATFARQNASTTSSNIARISSFIAGPALQAIFDAPWALLFFLVVFMLHPTVATIGLAIAGLLLLLAVSGHFLGQKSVKASLAARTQANGVAGHLDRNRSLLSTMGMATNLIAVHRRFLDGHQTFKQRATEPDLMRQAAAKFLRMSAQILILGAGALYVVRGELTGGAMIASTILLTRALSPVEQLASAIPKMIEARAARDDLNALLNEQDDPLDRNNLQRPSGDLTCSNLTVPAGPGQPPILHQINCKFSEGSCVAIMGPSGSGKSTLAHLIAGAEAPKIGSVRIGELDLHRWHGSQRGNFIGFMPQNSALFPGTIAENIARFIEDAQPVEILNASKAAGTHGLVTTLPNAYETRLEYDGNPLSGGEQQRIALARALFRSPKVVVLDEPNASLDKEGERALISALSYLKKQGATVIMVAHRAGILTLADQILLLDAGRIRDFGPKGEVIARMNARTLQIDLEREPAEMSRLEDWISSHFKRENDAEVRSNAAMLAIEMFNISLTSARKSDEKKPIRFTLKHRRGMCTISMHDTCELIASSRVDRLRRIADDDMLLAPALEGSDLALLMVMQLAETFEQQAAEYGRVIKTEIVTPIPEEDGPLDQLRSN